MVGPRRAEFGIGSTGLSSPGARVAAPEPVPRSYPLLHYYTLEPNANGDMDPGKPLFCLQLIHLLILGLQGTYGASIRARGAPGIFGGQTQ